MKLFLLCLYSKDITKFWILEKNDQSKEGNCRNEPKKIRVEKSSIKSLSEMLDDVFEEAKISYMCRNSFYKM